MKNNKQLLERLAELSKKSGVITGLATVLLVATLLNPLAVNAEGINAVDGSLPDEIIFIDDSSSSPGSDSSNGQEEFSDPEIPSVSVLPVDENMPTLTDVASDDQINVRANYIYNKLSSDLGQLPYDSEFVSGMVKIFNSRRPLNSDELTNEKILLYLQQYYEMFYLYIDPTVDYYNGTNDNKPVAKSIPISAFSKDNIMGNDITKNLEYCINGMLSANSREEAKSFVKMYAEIVFYSFYLKGGNGYTSHYLVENTGVRLLNILTVMAAHPLAASIDNPILEYHGSNGVGEQVDCKITLQELIEKINYQECPMTAANANILNDAINLTIAEANQSAYTYSN